MSNEFEIDFKWNPNGNPMEFNGFLMDCRWMSHGFQIVSNPLANPLAIHWKPIWNAMDIHWKSIGNPLASIRSPLEIRLTSMWNPLGINWNKWLSTRTPFEITWKSIGDPSQIHLKPFGKIDLQSIRDWFEKYLEVKSIGDPSQIQLKSLEKRNCNRLEIDLNNI